MIASANFKSPVDDPLHDRFQALLPRIERHGQVYFRHVKCPFAKADFIAEMIAISWKWFRRLAEKGKDASKFPMALASYAARAVKCGRRVCGQAKSKDVLNEIAQRRHGFRVDSLPTSTCTARDLYGKVGGQRKHDEFEERLTDNTVTPVPEQAAFRIDFPSWLQTLTGRERHLIREMVRNERTKDLARRFELSPARISQFRREFEQDWKRFWAERPATGVA